METVTAHGAQIPTIGFGTFELDGPSVRRVLPEVLAMGYRHVDTAQIYGNEADVGAVLEGSGLARSTVFLTTKVWIDTFREGELQVSVEKSLERLRTDYVDLLLLHWPNPAVPLEETISALNIVHELGQARHIGVSNFPVALFRKACTLSVAPIAVNQVEYHPYLDQQKVLQAVRDTDAALTAYSPLARGKVAGDKTLQAIAKHYERTPAQVALRWLTQQDRVNAIPKSTSVQHAQANLEIFDFILTGEEMDRIAGLARPDGRLIDPQGLSPDWD